MVYTGLKVGVRFHGASDKTVESREKQPIERGQRMAVQTVQDQYVQVGQYNTRFQTQGNGGSNVILIHGLGGYLEHWQQNIESLADRHRVYALDLVGFGRSDKPEADYCLPFFARFVRDFMDCQGIERATLVGNSLGGSIALQFAIDFPSRVEKLVLVDSAGLGKDVTIFLRLVTLPLLGERLTRPRPPRRT